ncbi:MAG TPA: hypothetical protein VGK29_07075 [Paludibaculum sp.]
MGFAHGEVAAGNGIDVAPGGLDGGVAFTHFNIEGGGFDGAAADGAPDVAYGEFHVDGVDIGDGLVFGGDGIADEG